MQLSSTLFMSATWRSLQTDFDKIFIHFSANFKQNLRQNDRQTDKTNKQTDKQTNRQTDKHKWNHNFLAEVINAFYSFKKNIRSHVKVKLSHNFFTSANWVTSTENSDDILRRSFATIFVNCRKIALSFGIMLSWILLQFTKSKPLSVTNVFLTLLSFSIHVLISPNCFY